MDGTSSSTADGPQAGETYWTVGDAADRAGVPYVQLIEWIRRGDLAVELGGREGKEVRLVKASDVEALAPSQFGGGRPGASAPPPGGEARTPGLEPPLPPLTGVFESGARSSEEGRLREELAQAHARIAELSSESEALGREVVDLRGKVGELERRPPRLSAVQGPAPPVARPFVPPDRRGTGQTVASAVLVTTGLLFGAVFARWMGASAGGDASPAEGAAMAAWTPMDSVDGWLPTLSGGSDRQAGERPSSQPGIAGADGQPAQKNTPPTEETAEALGPGPMPLGKVIEASASRVPAGATEAPSPVGGDPSSAQGKRWLADVLRGDGGSGATGGKARSCAYGTLVGGADPLAIGPCFAGVFLEDPDGGAGLALATHRVEGVPCCAHHAFVERMTRASADRRALERIAREAEASRADGVLPPLLRLRAERSARRFVEDAIGARWFDAGLSNARSPGEGGRLEHRWDLESHTADQGKGPADDDRVETTAEDIRLRLRSWVIEREGADPRAFELVMTMRSRAPGDLRESFRWVETESDR